MESKQIKKKKEISLRSNLLRDLDTSGVIDWAQNNTQPIFEHRFPSMFKESV